MCVGDVDATALDLIRKPWDFDVMVMENMFGDILTDLGGAVSGGIGYASSANLNPGGVSMFEPVHGSAPDIAGLGVANPSGMLLAAVELLDHVGQSEVAERVRLAWLTTIEQGFHTADVYSAERSAALVGTEEFAAAVIANLGREPQQLGSRRAAGRGPIDLAAIDRPRALASKTLQGVDVFLDWRGEPGQLGARLVEAGSAELPLQMITNRGVKVWPAGQPETTCVDHWRCRFLAPAGAAVTHAEIIALLERVLELGFDFIKTEHLCAFDGVAGYSLGQGQ